jgi:hypothetical protein
LKVQSNVEFGKEGKGEKSAVSQDKFGPVVT